MECKHLRTQAGLSGGLSGSVLVICLDCGAKWKPNDRYTERVPRSALSRAGGGHEKTPGH